MTERVGSIPCYRESGVGETGYEEFAENPS